MDSIAGQSYNGPIECLLIDDKGKDNSVKVVLSYIETYVGDVEFKLLHHETNRGLSAARNTGIENAIGEYILFQDSDDTLHPNALEKLLNVFCTFDNIGVASALLGAYDGNKQMSSFLDKWIHEDGEPKRVVAKDVTLSLISQSICHSACCKLFKRSVLLDIRFVEGRINEDSRFALDLGRSLVSVNLDLLELPDRLYFYRINPDGICSDWERLRMAEIKNMIDIRDITLADEVKDYASKWVFDAEYDWLIRQKKASVENWMRKDFVRYGVLHVYKLGYSKKKCIKFLLYKLGMQSLC